MLQGQVTMVTEEYQTAVDSFQQFMELQPRYGMVELLLANALLKAGHEEEAEQQSKTIYVGNLPYKANEQEVRKLFAQYGSVLSVRLLKDRQTGKRRGFGFVEMPNDDEALAAIEGLNDQDFDGRTIVVKKAEPRENRGGGGYNRGGGGGGYNRGGGGGGYNRGGGGGDYNRY